MYLYRNNPLNARIVNKDILNNSISDFLGADFTVNQPASNIVEMEDKFLIELAVPGLSKEDFHVKLDKNYLIISSEKTKAEVVNEEKFTRKEFNYDSFKRSFMLPKSVNKEEISAEYVNGILSVSLLKREEEKEKDAIEIKIQ